MFIKKRRTQTEKTKGTGMRKMNERMKGTITQKEIRRYIKEVNMGPAKMSMDAESTMEKNEMFTQHTTQANTKKGMLKQSEYQKQSTRRRRAGKNCIAMPPKPELFRNP